MSFRLALNVRKYFEIFSLSVRLMFQGLIITAIFIACSASLKAQSVTSGLRGTVTDQQNAVVPNANVKLIEPSTNQTKIVVTDTNGNYEFGEIKPGIYKISISKQGFSDYVAENVVIENLQIRRIDAQLQVSGAGTNVVSVDAGAAVITTEGGTISSKFDKARIADHPVPDTYPSPYSLFVTLPGVQGNGWDLSVSGQNPSQQTIGLDGVINDRFGEQNNNINFYEEATITTVNATADNSRVVNYNLVSKRGKNQFHGMAYYKRFDSVFNARDFFAQEKYPELIHEAQGEVSGPIWKNKTFFYFSMFHQRIPTGTPMTAVVPTANWKNGDFSDLLAQGIVITDPLTGNPFPGNKIPVNRMSTVSQKIQSLLFPLGNEPEPEYNNALIYYEWLHPYAGDFYKGTFPFIRIDHEFTKNNSFYAKWTQRNTPYILPNQLPSLFWTRHRKHGNFSASDSHIFTPKVINTFTFGWSRDYIEDGKTFDKEFVPIDGSQFISNVGLQGVNPGKYTGAGITTIDFSNFTDISTVSGGIRNNDDTFSFQDNLTWITGKHSLKFGGEVNTFKTFFGEIPNYGNLRFDGSFTGYDYADFLLGYPVSSSRTSPRNNRIRRNKEIGLFFSDSYKVNNRLTLDFGLRWDYYGVPKIEDGLQYNFDLATGNVVIPPGTLPEVDPAYPSSIKIVEGDVLPKSDLTNFRPRISFAYDFGNSLILRGGYGQFTERFSRFYFELMGINGPFAKFAESYNNTTDASGAPVLSLPNPFPATQNGRSPQGGQSVQGLPMQEESGTIHQYNVSVEKELFGLGWRASYIGSRGVNLRYLLPLNNRPPSATGQILPRRFPQFNNVTYLDNGFGSKFNSMQFEIQRKRASFAFDAHYTYSSNKSNLYFERRTGGYLPASPDIFNPYSQWVNDSVTRKHMFVATTQWAVPIGRNGWVLRDAPGFVEAVLGGWRLQTVSMLGSGQYFTPYTCGQSQARYGTYNGGCVRPNVTGDPMDVSGGRTIDNWFNGTVYSVPAPGTYGNALANSIEGPGLNVHHLSLIKSVLLKERFKFTYTLGIGNLFNHPNFSNPSGDVSCVATGCGINPIGVGGTLGAGGGAPENGGYRTMYMKLRFEF